MNIQTASQRTIQTEKSLKRKVMKEVHQKENAANSTEESSNGTESEESQESESEGTPALESDLETSDSENESTSSSEDDSEDTDTDFSIEDDVFYVTSVANLRRREVMGVENSFKNKEPKNLKKGKKSQSVNSRQRKLT